MKTTVKCWSPEGLEKIENEDEGPVMDVITSAILYFTGKWGHGPTDIRIHIESGGVSE